MSGATDVDLTTDEVALLRERFEEWKAEYVPLVGSPWPLKLTAHPVFRESLRALIEDHGYGLMFVSVMIGVSRERVRQWANQCGITQRRSKYRVWDDDQNKFVAVGSAAAYHKIKCGTSGKRVTKLKWIAKRRRIAIWVLVDLGEDLDRVPAHVDLADAYSVAGGELNAQALSVTSYKGSMTDQCDEIWREAGYPERPNMAKGGAGRPDREHKTGHHMKKLAPPGSEETQGDSPE